MQHHFAPLLEPFRGKIGFLQRDPAGAEGFEIHAGAAGQTFQAHLQRCGEKDVQVIAGPQVRVAGVRALRQDHRPQGSGHRRFQRTGVAVVGAV